MYICTSAFVSFETYPIFNSCQSQRGGGDVDLPSSAGYSLPWGRFPVSFIEISPSTHGLPLHCLSQGELTWFGKFTLGCPAPSERVASTYHLSSTPPHTPAHIPTEFGKDPSTLVFPGVVTLCWYGGFIQHHTHDTGETVSPVPLELGTCPIMPWGGQCVPITYPRGQTPVSTLFFGGNCPRHRGEGAEQQPPTVPSLQSCRGHNSCPSHSRHLGSSIPSTLPLAPGQRYRGRSAQFLPLWWPPL